MGEGCRCGSSTGPVRVVDRLAPSLRGAARERLSIPILTEVKLSQPSEPAAESGVPAEGDAPTIEVDEAEKVFVTARSLRRDSLRLAERIWGSGYRPNFLVGVWRGGTPPGIAIHEYIRLQGSDPYHTTIKTQSYSGMQRDGDGVEIKGLDHVIHVIEATDRMLIVDDVFDTGHTMKAILGEIRRRARRNTPEMRTATVYYKPERNETDIAPDYHLVEDNRWIVFPHELEGLTDEEIRRKHPEVVDAVLED